jgi:Na+-transporting methylmalonyl-CoA/oxaloacetate decarboxylase gamma subunit
MANQDEHDNNTDPSLSPTDSDDAADNVKGSMKALFIAIGGLALVLSILILLPMFLTYLSEGDSRAPSEIHATDTAAKSGQNTYNVVKPDK